MLTYQPDAGPLPLEMPLRHEGEVAAVAFSPDGRTVEKDFLPMQMLIFCYPILAVSIIYCLWNRYERARLLRVWTAFANQIH